jgi:hypothetical protein
MDMLQLTEFAFFAIAAVALLGIFPARLNDDIGWPKTRQRPRRSAAQ